MSVRAIKILLVEDNPVEARLLCETLAEVGSTPFEVEQVERISEARELLSRTNTDVVLLDLSLPDAHGLESIERIYDAAPKVPIVVLTGLNDEALAVKAVRDGAQDYLIKGQIAGPMLERSLRYAIERSRAQNAERLRSRELEALFNIASILARPGRFDEKVAPVLDELVEVSGADWVTLRRASVGGQHLDLVAAAGPAIGESPPLPFLDGQESLSGEAIRRSQLIVVNDYPSHPKAPRTNVNLGMKSLVLIPLKAEGRSMGVLNLVSREPNFFTPELARLLTAIVDGLAVLLENSRLNEELTLKEKLEQRQSTFISLASHELRTPMTSIMGFSELLLCWEQPEPIKRRWLDRIYQGSKRLASIVDELLSVSRIQSGKLIFNPEPLDLREVIRSELDSIVPTTDKHEFREKVSPNLPWYWPTATS